MKRKGSKARKGIFFADIAVAVILVSSTLALVIFGVKASLHGLVGKIETSNDERVALAIADRLLKSCELMECDEYVHSHVVDVSKASALVESKGVYGAYGWNASIEVKGLEQVVEASHAKSSASNRICSKRLVLFDGEEKILEVCVER